MGMYARPWHMSMGISYPLGVTRRCRPPALMDLSSTLHPHASICSEEWIDVSWPGSLAYWLKIPMIGPFWVGRTPACTTILRSVT